MKPFTVIKEASLIEALKDFFPESSKRSLLQWIKFKRIQVNETLITDPRFALEEGDQVFLLDRAHEALGIPLIYKDKWLIVINKPAGLLSVPNENGEINALHLLREHFKQPEIEPAHRIDQETSGVLLFARSQDVKKRLIPLFSQHTIEREYRAVVLGSLPQEKGKWESYLKELPNFHVVETSEQEGEYACTHYHVLKRMKTACYVSLVLETGKKHQIRVQAAQRGFPILGDKRYGDKHQKGRMFLHAYSLKFSHPFTGKAMEFQAPLPRHFQRFGLINQTLARPEDS